MEEQQAKKKRAGEADQDAPEVEGVEYEHDEAFFSEIPVGMREAEPGFPETDQDDALTEEDKKKRNDRKAA